MQTEAARSFYFGRRTGSPFTAGDAQITPESLLLLLHWRHWGYVWNWPIAVSVTRDDQSERHASERHAIVDVTRLALWSLGLAAVVMALGFRLLPGERQNKA